MEKIIAVDFDNTLCESDFPDIIAPKPSVIEYVLEEQRKGAKLILWTCRVGVHLEEAIEWCREHGIIFDAINDNVDETKEKFMECGRKIYADMYIDDKGVLPIFCKKGFRNRIREFCNNIIEGLFQ